MDLLTGLPHYVLSFLVLLTVVVFFHELGHFWVARRCGVRVEVFSIGFGPELFGLTDRKGTRWKFSAVPLGGYVKMFGQTEQVIDSDGHERPMTEAEKGVSFQHKPLWQRAAIVVAGPAANYLLAIVVFAGFFAILGQPNVAPVVGSVVAGSAAEAAGVLPGDRIVSINGRPIERFDDIVEAVELDLSDTLNVVMERGGQRTTLQLAPQVVETTDRFGNVHRVRRLGIGSTTEVEVVQYDPLSAIVVAVKETYRFSTQILTAVWQMITGARSSEDLGGILRIGKAAGDFAELGVLPFIELMAKLSINLGLLNLFPIPLLDGGHLVFYAAEAIRGRPLGERAQEWGMRVGVAFVLGLMVFATWNDLVYLKVVDFIKNLVT